MILRYRFALLALLLHTTAAFAAAPFRFEDHKSLDDMRAFIERHYPLGSSREDVRQAFVAEGGGTLKIHPTQDNAEKYLYDINLCGFYMWRWNISADFDAGGHLLQAYVNGRRVFMGGKPPRAVRYDDDSAITGAFRVINSARRWPQITSGIGKVPFQLFDGDGDIRTTDDQYANGAGPSGVDPARLGEMTFYNEVEPWRSIFDQDESGGVHMYPACPAAPAKSRAAPAKSKAAPAKPAP